jgi:hypothetical protein
MNLKPATRYQTFPQGKPGLFEVRDTVEGFAVKSNLSMADALELAADFNNSKPGPSESTTELACEFPHGEFAPQANIGPLH